MPALYGLMRGTPIRILDGILGTTIEILKNGTIDELFPMMVERENIPVIFNFDVEVINFLILKPKINKITMKSAESVQKM